ncbi:MAG TPA: sigma-54 dependent transcriptional regulator [Phycisphaerae bacterium]|nr:sigma-54 dependent transcriptional regulator [Phycisphaerae bacterium]HOJ72885.1 sigma-54 dependent transcriptional regulator [Phycisphaerae bacterium]HOM50069.1 sigma-54 dependent transcriptional regulator [Phycisphaerae bacterium]HON66072.1 sigma-54 dependent transcriptional regulator [Phycisphaerae bacterium]HOQ86114.1 sigma-54 dependent transcriptional regulator [Phycisphaerae bacterium]
MSTSPEQTVIPAPQRILVIDDEMVVGLACQRTLSADGHQVECCQDPQAGLNMALTGGFDLILVDLMMPGLGGIEILKHLRAAGVSSEVVIVTGHSTVETAVEAMKEGAADYISKPFSPNQLKMVLKKVWERSTLVRENASLRQELEMQRGLEGIIGESRPMERVFSLIRRVAPTDGTVLVTGESGTGKEMVVRAIHRLSRRKDHALVGCDCSALAPSLLESELFGHVKGSFTGAIATKQGLFEAANKGTLFLDEVASLSMETQGKLLRVLETKRVKMVGDTTEREVDIRLVAATNRELSEMVEEGTFREDLYYRLNVVPIYLPPLRERQGDVPRLAMSFLDRFCRKNNVEVKGFSPEAMACMESYHWPGNVRELRNIVERMAILCDADRIEVRHLPAEIRQAPPRPTITSIPTTWEEFKRLKQQVRDSAVQDLERRFLMGALQRSEGNVSRAAEQVGMQRTNFHALMRRYGLTSEIAP